MSKSKKCNNSKAKSYNTGIMALALILLFVIIMASMVLKYSVKFNWGIGKGVHLDLSPATYSVETVPSSDVTESESCEASLESTSALSK